MNALTIDDDRGLLHAVVGDGRPLLLLTGLSLLLSGGFALFLTLTGQFLPHDLQFLGMSAAELCQLHDCRIVRFMMHDRGAFGGALMAIGVLYLWLVEFPLRRGEVWAWWTLLLSGLVGFGSFLAYLGYGYLDTWHGTATLLLLPCFAVGLVRSFIALPAPRHARALLVPAFAPRWTSAAGIGRGCLLATALGMMGAGLTIMIVGMTVVFVPQDLAFLGLNTSELQAINRKLMPLIAHDRAGFGGAICTAGIAVWCCVWCGTPARSLWQVLGLAGGIGFTAAISVHPLVGYNDVAHLAPAMLGALVLISGLALSRASMHANS